MREEMQRAEHGKVRVTGKQRAHGSRGRSLSLLPQRISPFLVQVVCHLVHLLLLLCPDGHDSGIVLLLLGLNLLLQTQTAQMFPYPAYTLFFLTL